MIHVPPPDVRAVPVFIYGLSEADGPIRYVGKSSNPARRISSHESRAGNPRVSAWLRGLRARGEKVAVSVLHEVEPGVDAARVEQYFIQFFSRVGPLFNRQHVDKARRQARGFARKIARAA